MKSLWGSRRKKQEENEAVVQDYVILDGNIGATLPRSTRTSSRAASQNADAASTSTNIRARPAAIDGQLSIAWRNQLQFDQDLARREGPSVSVLDCSYNQLYNFGFLKHFPLLTMLVLDHNHLDGLKIPKLRNLTTLWLNHNEITNIENLLDTLKRKTPQLQHLSLLGNTGVPSYLNGGTQLEYIQYRLFVAGELPGLLSLDCSEFSADELSQATAIISGAHTSRVATLPTARHWESDEHPSPTATTPDKASSAPSPAAPRPRPPTRPRPAPKADTHRASAPGVVSSSPVIDAGNVDCVARVAGKPDAESSDEALSSTLSSEDEDDSNQRSTSAGGPSRRVRLNLINDSDDSASVHSPEGSLFGDDDGSTDDDGYTTAVGERRASVHVGSVRTAHSQDGAHRRAHAIVGDATLRSGGLAHALAGVALQRYCASSGIAPTGEDEEQTAPAQGTVPTVAGRSSPQPQPARELNIDRGDGNTPTPTAQQSVPVLRSDTATISGAVPSSGLRPGWLVGLVRDDESDSVDGGEEDEWDSTDSDTH